MSTEPDEQSWAEDCELCFVSKVARMAGTMHLTVDGKHALCGRPVVCVVPLTIYTLVRYHCGSCADVAWSRERKRLASLEKEKSDE